MGHQMNSTKVTEVEDIEIKKSATWKVDMEVIWSNMWE